MVIEGESCCQLFLFYFSNKILSVFKLNTAKYSKRLKKTCFFVVNYYNGS